MPEEIYARNDEGMPMWSVEPQGISNGSMPEARYIRADLQSQSRVGKMIAALKWYADWYGDGYMGDLAREALKEFEG